MPKTISEYMIFPLFEERKGNKSYRRFFGIDVVNILEIVRLNLVNKSYPSITFIDLISLFPKMKPYEINESSKAIIVEYKNTCTGIVVPKVDCILKVRKYLVKSPVKYLKYLSHDSIIGVIGRGYVGHLVFLLDIESIISAKS